MTLFCSGAGSTILAIFWVDTSGGNPSHLKLSWLVNQLTNSGWVLSLIGELGTIIRTDDFSSRKKYCVVAHNLLISSPL
jgi:hypothetical protein